MVLYTSYKVKIKSYNRIFQNTVKLYTKAVQFFLNVILENWDYVSSVGTLKQSYNLVEELTIKTKKNPSPKYDFNAKFYKFPCYLRRAAIAAAFGKVSSYKSNFKNWEENPVGNKPSIPTINIEMPAMYKDNMYVRTGKYTAKIKVFVHNTWDWLEVNLRKSDIDYIEHHCSLRKAYVPVLQKIGKEWFLRFAFSENCKLNDTPIKEKVIVAVDLGLNNPCTCVAMLSNGTIVGRSFLKLPSETDHLHHAINRIKKAQQHGVYRMPRLWAKAKGINTDIASITAQFIIDFAVLYNADVIVFEYLDLNGKKRGSKKQKLHLWKARSVQNIVNNKAHRLGIRISHVSARNTSKLAFDGSGIVERGKYLQNGVERYNYSICTFATGKQYNCDLNAAYNIGARYFIREILKSLPEMSRLSIVAKVPQLDKRSTCTLSSLISFNAALAV